MRSFGRYSVGIVLLFALAVGSKIWLRGQGGGEAVAAPRSIVTEAADRHGFWTLPVPPDDAQLDRVTIARGQCSAVVTTASLLGIHRSAIRMSAAPGEQVYFVYRGQKYDDQPLWATVTDHYFSRIARVFGRSGGTHPLFGVAASSYCRPDALSWLETDF